VVSDLARVHGRLFSVGDADQEFAIESISKLFVFALVCHALGHEQARRKLGVNSTGLPFNSVMAIELNPDAQSQAVRMPDTGTPRQGAG
jgi:glutaminase